MVLTRRSALRLAGTSGLAALAGCSSIGTRQQTASTYSLDIDRIQQSVIEYALTEPRGDGVFAGTEQAAYDAILPNGRYSTYGFKSITEDQYVHHDDHFYQTKVIVTGEQLMERVLVRVERMEENVPHDTIHIESLPQASSRVFKILHANSVTNGEGGGSTLLHGDAYVLRRPPEVNGPIPADLDGKVVTIDPEGNWAYRVRVSESKLYETEYTALAVEVATSEAAFRRVVFGAVVDKRLRSTDLSSAEREVLEQAIDRDVYRESTPLSDEYKALLTSLGLEKETVRKGHVLWYDGHPYRYRLYVNEGQ